MYLDTELDTRIFVTTNPSESTLWTVIRAMDSDPLSNTSYTDSRLRPTTWIDAIQNGHIIPFFWSLNDNVGGAYWLHDVGWDSEGKISYAWTGMYHLPQYRGNKAAAAWQMILLHMREKGVKRLFGACRVSNTRAQQFVEQKMGYTRLGMFPKWMPFEGEMDDVILYSIRQQDESLAWQLAASRATEAQRLHSERELVS